MLRRRTACAAAACVLLTSPLPSEAVGQTARPQAWQSDIRALVDMFESRHPAPYHSVSREEFRGAAEQLVQRVPSLDDEAIVVELARLMASVGDGHTGVFVPWDLPYARLPLEFWRLDDGLLVAAASTAYPHLAGARILEIDGRTVENILPRVDSLTSADNRWGRRGPARLLGYPVILRHLGVADSRDALTLTSETANGAVRVDTVRAVPKELDVDWRWPWDAPPLWLGQRDRRYWFRALPDRRALYFQYNDASWQDEEESLVAFADRLVDAATEAPVERVIVDLRWNDGGSDRWTNIVLHALIRIESALGQPRGESRVPGPPLFVLIGPTTFSAATSFALDLEEHTNAVFVGEPTGGRPVGYGGQSFLDLPETGLRVRSSFRFQISSFPGDDREALYPHVAAPPTIAAFREGRDPALEAALAWRSVDAVAVRVARAAASGDTEAVQELWHRWREDPAHRWQSVERDLNSAAYGLLGDDAVAAAIIVFRLNAEAHPESANAHDSLGEALARAGDVRGALAAYSEALELDPDGPIGQNARRRIEELGG